jgi:hypothetical protein
MYHGALEKTSGYMAGMTSERHTRGMRLLLQRSGNLNTGIYGSSFML